MRLVKSVPSELGAFAASGRRSIDNYKASPTFPYWQYLISVTATKCLLYDPHPRIVSKHCLLIHPLSQIDVGTLCVPYA